MQASSLAYSSLSSSLKEKVGLETISGDLARIVGVQDVPDQGISVEDLQVYENEVVLVVGLNYSGGGRVLRGVHLIIEDNDWKVNKVSKVESQ